MGPEDRTQNEVLNFLASPDAHGGLPVKQIDTHAASIFLSGSRALKVKRVVKFPFLDYSTLDLRKQACLAEIEVNRRFAPELYVGVSRITRTAGGSLEIGGNGEVVEWAVEMRRFDDSLTLDLYCREHQISAQMARSIAERLAKAHKTTPHYEAAGWLSALKRFVAEHHSVFSTHPELFEPGQAALLLEKSQKLLAQNVELIAARATAGLLVRGHGDLHLGNIALIDGEPVIFDAVEFDPEIASGDVLYDLAFLLMDLVVCEQREAANVALNAYLQFSGRDENFDALRLFPLFLSIRSAIRAIVAAARFDHSSKAEDSAASKRYFEAAVKFLRSKNARLVAIGGLSGTGKSHLARMLGPHILPEPGAVILRSDVRRKSLFGVGEFVRLSSEGYTKEASEAVYRSVLANAERALAAGHSVILDAVFSKAEEREAAGRLADEAGVPFTGFFLEADIETRVSRIELRRDDASDADRRIAMAQEAQPVEEPGWKSIDSRGRPEETLRSALSLLSAPR